MPQSELGKSALDKLVKAGACDSLLPPPIPAQGKEKEIPGGHRAQLVEVIERVFKAVKKVHGFEARGQLSLFDQLDQVEYQKMQLPSVPPWSQAQLLAYEKEMLDFYVSAHPLALIADELRKLTSHDVARLKAMLPGEMKLSPKERTTLVLAGLVGELRPMYVKNPQAGKPSKYARFKLEDLTGAAECVIWPSSYQSFEGLLKDGEAVIVKATLEQNRDEAGLVVHSIHTVEQTKRRLGGGIALAMRAEWPPDLIDRIKDELARHPYNGNEPNPARCPIWLYVYLKDGLVVVLRVAQRLWPDADTVELEALEKIVGAGNATWRGLRKHSSLPVAAGERPAHCVPHNHLTLFAAAWMRSTHWNGQPSSSSL